MNHKKLFLVYNLLLVILFASAIKLKHVETTSFGKDGQSSPIIDGFRPPAVPLIVFDPYMSIWSFSDHLTDDWPRLWDGTIKAFTGMIRIDGTIYRFMGPQDVGTNSVMPQKSVKVFPTRTVYEFATNEISLTLAFTTPTIPTDLDELSRPLTYLTYIVASLDGKSHDVQIYYDNTGEISVNTVDEEIVWQHVQQQKAPETILKMGTSQQAILGNSGDKVGINWGYAYVAVDSAHRATVDSVIAGSTTVRNQFINSGTIPTADDTRMPRACSDDWPVMAVVWNLANVTSEPVEKYLTFMYDDIFSINYFGKQLPPYWRRNGQGHLQMLTNASRDYRSTIEKCINFDKQLLSTISSKTNSPQYTTIASLAFRQTFGGCKLTWHDEKNLPWYFMKEISSDGDLSTVDVIFPASPLIVYMNPYLMELLMLPLLAYANNETNIDYNLAWAPHHLGFYPIGNIEPNNQEQMPVEETGNMLMMLTSLAHFSEKHDPQTGIPEYLSLILPHYGDLIRSWAEYLNSGAGVLPDPGDQLCTDDFEGPSPHNVNLAAKGISALDCYAYYCQLLGQTTESQKYHSISLNFTKYWIQNADDGDHYRLQYNLPNTWSLKYNLMYQKVFGLTTFPQSVIDDEVNYYINHQFNKYGVPLNDIKTFTKLDWSSWIAAMASSDQQFNTIINAIYNFANESPSRVPLTDWYDTISAEQSGFQARTVVGGFYAEMLMK